MGGIIWVLVRGIPWFTEREGTRGKEDWSSGGKIKWNLSRLFKGGKDRYFGVPRREERS